MGPFPPEKRKVKFIVVTVNYFTKWMKVEIVVKIKTKKITKLLWKNVVYRFGISQSIISNNGK